MKISGRKTHTKTRLLKADGAVMFPTPELRYKGKTLQQKWVNPVTGEDTWKDIPTV